MKKIIMSLMFCFVVSSFLFSQNIKESKQLEAFFYAQELTKKVLIIKEEFQLTLTMGFNMDTISNPRNIFFGKTDSIYASLINSDLELISSYLEDFNSKKFDSTFKYVGPFVAELLIEAENTLVFLKENLETEIAYYPEYDFKKKTRPVTKKPAVVKSIAMSGTKKIPGTYSKEEYEITSNETEKTTESFDKVFLNSVDSSVFQLLYEEVSEEGDTALYCGHCSLYANNKNKSYLIMPKHVFDHDTAVTYIDIILVNAFGKITELSFSDLKWADFETQDAEVLEVPIISGIPTLREKIVEYNQLTKPGDSIALLSIFNINGIERKFGLLSNKSKAVMNYENFAESGDSGSLVIGQNEVIGVVYAINLANASEMFFVSINTFEKLYMNLLLRNQ